MPFDDMQSYTTLPDGAVIQVLDADGIFDEHGTAVAVWQWIIDHPDHFDQSAIDWAQGNLDAE